MSDALNVIVKDCAQFRAAGFAEHDEAKAHEESREDIRVQSTWRAKAKSTGLKTLPAAGRRPLQRQSNMAS